MKNYIKLLTVPALALTLLTGCGGGGQVSHSAEVDELDVLPENVLNYSGDIDCYIYVEGQQGTMLDVGHKNYEAKDLWDAYFARFYAAAKEFNKFVPNAKINIYYTSIGTYNTDIANYNLQKGHLPHIMHATDHVNEMIARGYATDLSIYKDSPYYKVFDESIMKEFNFGGFQGAIPYMIYPMGIFVNTAILENTYIEYDEDYVANFTMEKFYDDMAATTNNETAGISQPVEWLLSISAPSVYKSFVYDREVKLDDPLINELLEYEATIVNYSAYEPTGSEWKPKSAYAVNSWETTDNFVNDEVFTFSAEMPWNVGLVSNAATEAGKEEQFDLLPYPKANEDTETHIGMLAEGLTIGNQCPIQQGECSQESMDARDAAAYFAMFMNADPRAIKAKAEIQYTDAKKVNVYTGILDLPMVKRNYYYEWETGEDSEDNVKEEIFSYQLTLYLNNYKTYWTKESENDTPDVENYTNIKPGFKEVLRILYDEPENRVNFYGRPDDIPEGGTGGVKGILDDWSGRMFGDGTTLVTSSTWTGWVVSKLSSWERAINQNTQIAYDYLQEQIDNYYGAGIYVV